MNSTTSSRSLSFARAPGDNRMAPNIRTIANASTFKGIDFIEKCSTALRTFQTVARSLLSSQVCGFTLTAIGSCA